MNDHLHALPTGHLLGEYRIDGVLGSGGFGITYLAWDIHLDKPVAIKEYLPGEFALRTDTTTVKPKSTADQDAYQWGLARFMDEARALARFKHPHLNEVYRFLEGNGTAYMVLEYIEGETLAALLKREGRLDPARLRRLLDELLSGLEQVHATGYVHRDIKPGNIMLRPDGAAVLLDFGAARQAIGQRSKSITSILTPGYAPIEQYDQNATDVGPWTDLYALGMVAYRCLSGINDSGLPDAVTRSRLERKGEQHKDLAPAVEVGKGRHSQALLEAVDWAMRVDEEQRPQSVAAIRQALAGDDKPATVPLIIGPPFHNQQRKPSMPDHPQALPTGHLLSEYRIDDVLGSGGFGITYLTRDTHLDKVVAVKEYLPGEFALRADATTVKPKSAADQDAYQWGLARFTDEARAWARLDHPHLNKVYGCFERNGTAYMVLEYIQGETLAARLEREGQLDPDRLRRLLDELLAGLEEAHAAGLVHRDIKPGNIVLHEDGDAVLLDFGAARQALGQRTNSIASVLAPGYAPVEQYDRDATDIGPWTDFHALGMVAYRCISGIGDSELPDAAVRASWESDPERHNDLAAAMDVGKGRYDDSLLGFVDWAMEADKQRRPQSVAAIRQVLAGGDRPTVAAPSGGDRPAMAAPSGGDRPTVAAPSGGDRPTVEVLSDGDRSTVAAPSGGGSPTVAAPSGGDQPPESAKPATNRPGKRRRSVLVSALAALAVAAVGTMGWLVVQDEREVRLPGQVFRDCEQCPELVVLPTGAFMMGSPASEEGREDHEGPVHRVAIANPFAAGKYEVTGREFGRFVAATGYSTGDSCLTHEAGEWQERAGRDWQNPGFEQGEMGPVVCVNLSDARAYIEWLSNVAGKPYRLLSESEWEYAARAGTTTPFHFGDTVATDQANYNGLGIYGPGRKGVYREKAVAVGSFPANDFGLHDMHGNAFEWVADCWNDSYVGAPSDGSAWISGANCEAHMLRGGSWYLYPWYIRSANRLSLAPELRLNVISFRVARTLAP